jgi:hypothetical protein
MANDGDINFPPGQRRHKPTFEPPPWEREQFEELARRKQEEAVIPLVPDVREPADEDLTGLAENIVVVAEDSTPEAGAESEPEDEAPKLDEKQMALLMMRLRAEEPRPEKVYWKAITASGVVCVLVGLFLTTWGVVVAVTPKKPGPVGVIMVVGLVGFGLGFLGGGVWLILKSLRQQGVL